MLVSFWKFEVAQTPSFPSQTWFFRRQPRSLLPQAVGTDLNPLNRQWHGPADRIDARCLRRNKKLRTEQVPRYSSNKCLTSSNKKLLETRRAIHDLCPVTTCATVQVTQPNTTRHEPPI